MSDSFYSFKTKPQEGQRVLWIWAAAGQITAGDYHEGKARDAAKNYAVIEGEPPTHWKPWPSNWPGTKSETITTTLTLPVTITLTAEIHERRGVRYLHPIDADADFGKPVCWKLTHLLPEIPQAILDRMGHEFFEDFERAEAEAMAEARQIPIPGHTI